MTTRDTRGWPPRISPLRRWVAVGDYTWPRMTVFLVVRLVEIAVLLLVLRAVIRWGFDG